MASSYADLIRQRLAQGGSQTVSQATTGYGGSTPGGIPVTRDEARVEAAQRLAAALLNEKLRRVRAGEVGATPQSQMTNPQLQAQGPAYGSQAARVASSPSLPPIVVPDVQKDTYGGVADLHAQQSAVTAPQETVAPTYTPSTHWTAPVGAGGVPQTPQADAIRLLESNVNLPMTAEQAQASMDRTSQIAGNQQFIADTQKRIDTRTQELIGQGYDPMRAEMIAKQEVTDENLQWTRDNVDQLPVPGPLEMFSDIYTWYDQPRQAVITKMGDSAYGVATGRSGDWDPGWAAIAPANWMIPGLDSTRINQDFQRWAEDPRNAAIIRNAHENGFQSAVDRPRFTGGQAVWELFINSAGGFYKTFSDAFNDPTILLGVGQMGGDALKTSALKSASEGSGTLAAIKYATGQALSAPQGALDATVDAPFNLLGRGLNKATQAALPSDGPIMRVVKKAFENFQPTNRQRVTDQRELIEGTAEYAERVYGKYSQSGPGGPGSSGTPNGPDVPDAPTGGGIGSNDVPPTGGYDKRVVTDASGNKTWEIIDPNGDVHSGGYKWKPREGPQPNWNERDVQKIVRDLNRPADVERMASAGIVVPPDSWDWADPTRYRLTSWGEDHTTRDIPFRMTSDLRIPQETRQAMVTELTPAVEAHVQVMNDIDVNVIAKMKDRLPTGAAEAKIQAGTDIGAPVKTMEMLRFYAEDVFPVWQNYMGPVDETAYVFRYGDTPNAKDVNSLLEHAMFGTRDVVRMVDNGNGKMVPEVTSGTASQARRALREMGGNIEGVPATEVASNISAQRSRLFGDESLSQSATAVKSRESRARVAATPKAETVEAAAVDMGAGSVPGAPMIPDAPPVPALVPVPPKSKGGRTQFKLDLRADEASLKAAIADDTKLTKTPAGMRIRKDGVQTVVWSSSRKDPIEVSVKIMDTGRKHIVTTLSGEQIADATSLGEAVEIADAWLLGRIGSPADVKAVKKAVKESTQRPPVPKTVQRIEEVGVPISGADKPQGLYTSPAGIDSPHLDLGGNTVELKTNPNANVLNVDTGMVTSDRGRYIGEPAGVAALRKFIGDDATNAMLVLQRSDAINRVSAEYPSVDWNRYPDTHAVVETYGGLKARDAGYDAIWAVDPKDHAFDEYVGLTDKAFIGSPPAKVNPSADAVDFRLSYDEERALEDALSGDLYKSPGPSSLGPRRSYTPKNPINYEDGMQGYGDIGMVPDGEGGLVPDPSAAPQGVSDVTVSPIADAPKPDTSLGGISEAIQRGIQADENFTRWVQRKSGAVTGQGLDDVLANRDSSPIGIALRLGEITQETYDGLARIITWNKTQMPLYSAYEQLRLSGMEHREAVDTLLKVLAPFEEMKNAKTWLGKWWQKLVASNDSAYMKTLTVMRQQQQYNLANGAAKTLADQIGNSYTLMVTGSPLEALMIWNPVNYVKFGLIERGNKSLLNSITGVDRMRAMGVQPRHGVLELNAGRTEAADGSEMMLREITREVPLLNSRAAGAAYGIFANKTIKDIRNGGDRNARFTLYMGTFFREVNKGKAKFYNIVRNRAEVLKQDPDEWVRLVKSLGNDFSNEDVLRVLGDERLARDWREILGQADKTAYKTVNDKLFSYRQLKIDEKLRYVVFYHYWMSRAMLLHGKTALKNPFLMNAYINLWQGLQQKAEEEGYPDSVIGTLRFMQSNAGWLAYINPVTVVVPFDILLEQSDEDEGVADWLKNHGAFFNPIVDSALAVMGMTDRVTDLTQTKAVRRAIKAYVNWMNSNGHGNMIPNQIAEPNTLVVDPIDLIATRITQKANDAFANTFGKGWAQEFSMPDGYEMDVVSSILMTQMEDALGPNSTWTDTEWDQYLEAQEAILLHRDGNDYADAAVETMADQQAWTAAGGAIIPGGLQVRYGPRDAEMRDRDLGYEDAYDKRVLATSGGTEDSALTTSINRLEDVGTENGRNAYSAWNEIANMDTLPLSGIEKYIEVDGQRIYAKDIASLSFDQRAELADRWVEQYDATEELASYKKERELFILKHPELGDFKEFQKGVYGYDGGPRAWREMYAKKDGAFKQAMAEKEARLRQTHTQQGIIDRELDQWAASQEAYKVANGYRDSVYDNPVEPKVPDYGFAEKDVPASSGGSTGSSQAKTPIEKTRSAIENYNTKIEKAVTVMNASGYDVTADDLMFANPYYKKAFGMFDIPEMPYDATLFWQWKLLQPAGTDTSVDAYLSVLEGGQVAA